MNNRQNFMELWDLFNLKEAIRDMVEKEGRKVDEERLSMFMKSLTK